MLPGRSSTWLATNLLKMQQESYLRKLEQGSSAYRVWHISYIACVIIRLATVAVIGCPVSDRNIAMSSGALVESGTAKVGSENPRTRVDSG